MTFTAIRTSALFRRLRQNALIYSAYREVRDLWSYAKASRSGSFSQHGEDVFVRDWFSNRKDGFYVDIGASHPFRISNTYLLYRMGWHGVTVEPIPLLCRLQKRWRPRDIHVEKAIGPEKGEFKFYEMMPSVLSTVDSHTAEKYTAERNATLLRKYEISVITPAELFSEFVGDRTIDFLSMDIEGLDTQTIAAIDFAKVRPKLICVEINDTSERAVVLEILQQHGYKHVTDLGCNLFMEAEDA